LKIFISVLFLTASATFSFGQSLRLFSGSTDITGTTVNIPVLSSGSYSNTFDVHNITSAAVNYKVRRVIVNGPLDSACNVSYCLGVSCYPASHNIIYEPIGNGLTLAGNTNLFGVNGLAADFSTGPSCCDTYIEYLFYNKDVANDTARLFIHYDCTLGIHDFENAGGIISNAFPNPASSVTTFNYNLSSFSHSGKIVFYDVLGNVVKEIALTDKSGVAEINVADMTAGIYFYSLLVDEKAVMTKKIMITSGN
jgi:hypothetical protein